MTKKDNKALRSVLFITKFTDFTRLSRLSLHSLSDRRFTRDVVFLYSLINGHYNIDISDRLLFCKDRNNVGYDLRKNGSLELASMYSRTRGGAEDS